MTASAHALVALASSGPSPLWYATRATGTVAVLLLTATVALGIAAGGRYAPQRIARFEVSSLHRNLSLLTLAFLGLHIATAVSDSYTSIGWPAAFIPLASSYQPLWVGLGAVALDLLLAVAVTSALFHAVGTGTDTRLGPQLLLYAACLATVLAAVGWRIARTTGGAARRARVWGPPASVRVPVTLGASGENHEGEGRSNE
jgi:hypothetical protein